MCKSFLRSTVCVAEMQDVMQLRVHCIEALLFTFCMLDSGDRESI